MKNFSNNKKIMPKLNLEQITLIIPTYNRPQYLSRLLNYYASKKTNLTFLVLDSSNEETQKLNQQATVVLGTQVRYMAFPSSMPVAVKLLEGLKAVATPFSAFCADDDLVFVEGLVAAAEFLSQHPDYVCVDGIYLNFNQINHDIHLHIEYATKGIGAESACARVFKLYQKYESLFYGVFKAKDALNIFSSVIKNTSLHYQELFQATGALLIGKSHRLPIFYAARQHCAPAEEQRDKWQTYYWFADNPNEFIAHYLVYRDELWRFYDMHASEQKHDQAQFYKMMDIAHAMYFGVGCPPEYFHSVLGVAWQSDKFQKANEFQDNICNQLKSPWRVGIEEWVDKLTTWLPKQLGAIYLFHNKGKLNKMIQASTNQSWRCELRKDVRWLASVPIFHHAYYELCSYMDLEANKNERSFQ